MRRLPTEAEIGVVVVAIVAIIIWVFTTNAVNRTIRPPEDAVPKTISGYSLHLTTNNCENITEIVVYLAKDWRQEIGSITSDEEHAKVAKIVIDDYIGVFDTLLASYGN